MESGSRFIVTWQTVNGNTLIGKHMEEFTTVRMKIVAQSEACPPPGATEMLKAQSHQVETVSVGGGIVNCGGSVNWKAAYGKAVPISQPPQHSHA